MWQLFPIFLTEYKPCWDSWYAAERAFLSEILPRDVRISHIGSTVISAIWAKPIIDILVETPV